MNYGIFDAVNTGTDENPVYDRTVDAAFFTKLLECIKPNGVIGLAVSAGSGLNVSVASGKAMVNGVFAYQDSASTVSLSAGSSQRVYKICVRMSTSERNVTLVAIQGNISRTSEVHDLCLATVTVPAGASSITSSMINDTRSDGSVCGLLNQESAASNLPTITVGDNAPSNPKNGDIWVKPSEVANG